MKKITKKLALGVSTVLLSIAAIDASAFNSAVYRTYNLDRNCNYYYVAGCDRCSGGVAVYNGGRYSEARLAGLPLHRDCNGRMYAMDAWGNRIYVANHCCHKTCG